MHLLSLRRLLIQWLVACLVLVPFQANAGLIGTPEVADAAASRAAVAAFAARADVSRQLQSLGVDPASATARIAALSDAEAAQLAARIHQLPAGAGVEAALFIVLLGVLVWLLLK